MKELLLLFLEGAGSTWRDCLFSSWRGWPYLEGLLLPCLEGLALSGGTASSLP
jgi:hypothetical protein